MGNEDKPKIGRVDSTEIKVNRDGDRPVRLMKTELTDPEDLQTVEQFTQPGIDSNPPTDSIAEVMSNGNAYKVSVSINDKVDKSTNLNQGEIEIYSSDPDTSRFIKQATTRYKNNKDIVHNCKDLVTNADEDIEENAAEDIKLNAQKNIEATAQIDIICAALKKILITSEETTTLVAQTEIYVSSLKEIFIAGSELILNTGAKSAVNFPDLKIGFDAFVTAFNAHAHGTGPPPLSPFAGNIDASESSTIKVP